jgi:hypothetical protein
VKAAVQADYALDEQNNDLIGVFLLRKWAGVARDLLRTILDRGGAMTSGVPVPLERLFAAAVTIDNSLSRVR